MKPLTVKPIKKQSIPDTIIKELKALIDSGQIPQGGKLPAERELASLLNVSRPSLRVAIRVLSMFGILENRQGDGTYLVNSEHRPIETLSIILSMKKGALLDIFEARESIENTCAGLAACRRDEEDLHNLQKALENMRANYKNPDKYIEHDLNFHKAVIAASKNLVFVDLMDKTYKLLVSTRTEGQKYPSELYREKNFQQHIEIYKGIESSDPEKATIAMAHHMSNIKEKYLDGRKSKR